MEIYKFEEWGGEISIETLEAEEKEKIYVTKGICGYKKNINKTDINTLIFPGIMYCLDDNPKTFIECKILKLNEEISSLEEDIQHKNDKKDKLKKILLKTIISKINAKEK